jgi:hypothetical protein
MKNVLSNADNLFSNLRWTGNPKSLNAARVLVVLVAFFLSVFTASAQEINARPTETTREVKSSENSATTAASEFLSDAERPVGLVQVEAKINALLLDIRALLQTESCAARFRESLEKTFSMKAEQVCPSMDLVNLIKGSTSFRASSETEKQELYYAVDFLIDVLDELSALN